MKKKIGFICILVCIFLSCEKSIEVELPPVEEKIAVYGLFLTTEPISMLISHSKHIFDTTKSFHLENVVVDFYENDVFIETLKNKGLTSIGFDFISPSDFIPVDNNSYSIIITAEDFKPAFATVVVHETVPISRIDTFAVTGELPGWYCSHICSFNTVRPMLECRILFKDPPDVSNYYSLRVARNVYEMEQILYICNDPVLEFYDRIHVINGFESPYTLHNEYFSDRHIDGETYELVVLLDKSDLRGTIYFKLLSLSEEYYFYKKSVSPSYDVMYDPFREPEQVYSNIHNGVGIFAGASVSVDSLNITQQ
jgi:hypothetical protein